MANIEDITEDTQSNKENTKLSRSFRIGLVLFISSCIVTILLFFWKQWDTLTLSGHILYDVFGTFGDFIGGFLGTFVALYSVYLLVRTLGNQIETNENVRVTNKSVIETNQKLISQTDLQIFDSRFSTFLNLYKDAINAYDDGKGIRGRAAFEKIVDEFKTKGFTNNTEYKRRSIGAVSEYIQLYVQHRQNFSVHFRMLYLLSKLTAEEKIHERFRVSYAKSIRGQLSEGELLILRYNCLSPYGVKMRTYVNKFNLIKHLPIMNLLEFSLWRNIVNDDTYCSAIDRLAITLKKKMTEMLDKSSSGEEQSDYKVSPRLVFAFQLNAAHNIFKINFRIQKKKIKGGAIKRPTEEHAFDSIMDTNKVSDFLKEMFTEMFIYSNFGEFNGEDNNIISTKIVNDTSKEIEIEVKIERDGKPLALADRQVRPS